MMREIRDPHNPYWKNITIDEVYQLIKKWLLFVSKESEDKRLGLKRKEPKKNGKNTQIN